MLHKILNTPLANAPCVPLKQNAALGALIGAGSGLVGGIMSGLFGSSSQNSANQTALQVSREQNSFNQAEARKNREWQSAENALSRSWSEQQYEKELEWQRYLLGYNTPAEQMARYRAAGINPYFAMGNIQSGVLQSSPTAPTPAANSAAPATASGLPSIKAYDPSAAVGTAVSGVSSAVRSYFENANIAERTRSEAIQNITRLDESMARIDEILSRKNLNDAERDKYMSERETIERQRERQLKLLDNQNVLLEKQSAKIDVETKGESLKNEYQGLVNDFYAWESEFKKILAPWQLKEIKATISELGTRSDYNSAGAALNTAQKAYYGVLKDLTHSEDLSMKIDNEFKRRTQGIMINSALYGFKMQKYKYDTRYIDTGAEILGAAGSLIPMAAGAKYLGLFGKGATTVRGFR